MSVTWRAVFRPVLGLMLLSVGLWFAFLHSRTWDRLADGTVEVHYDHVALYVGVGVALFGMLMVSPDTVATAIKDAKGVLGQRLSGAVKPPDEGSHDG